MEVTEKKLKRCLSCHKISSKTVLCASNDNDVWNDTMFTARNGHCFRICLKLCVCVKRSERHSKWYGICVARKRDEAQRTDHIYRTLHIHTNLHRVACKQTSEQTFCFFSFIIFFFQRREEKKTKQWREWEYFKTTTQLQIRNAFAHTHSTKYIRCYYYWPTNAGV